MGTVAGAGVAGLDGLVSERSSSNGGGTVSLICRMSPVSELSEDDETIVRALGRFLGGIGLAELLELDGSGGRFVFGRVLIGGLWGRGGASPDGPARIADPDGPAGCPIRPFALRKHR